MTKIKDLQPELEATSRPVMTTGLMNGQERPLLNFETDVQANFPYVSPKSRYIAGPDGVERDNRRAWELLALREAREKPIKSEVYQFLRKLAKREEADLDFKIIAQRLVHSRLILYDKQSELARDIPASHAGAYAAVLKLAMVRLNQAKPSWFDRSVMLHEMTHAASGQTYTIKNGKLIIRNVGFHRGTNRNLPKDKKEISRFGWFNEGMTEYLTKLMRRENNVLYDNDIYRSEVALFQEIVEQSGIPLKIFLEAYFEEPDLSAKPGQRMPKWHALTAALDDKFGPRFLQRLEAMVAARNGDCGFLTKPNRQRETRIVQMRQAWQHRRLHKLSRTVLSVGPKAKRQAKMAA